MILTAFQPLNAYIITINKYLYSQQKHWIAGTRKPNTHKKYNS